MEKKDELVVRCMSDASYVKVKDSTGGSLVLLGSKNSAKVVPLYWKSKGITKVCTSTKDAETHALFKNVADASFSAANLELLLFGCQTKKIKVDKLELSWAKLSQY